MWDSQRLADLVKGKLKGDSSVKVAGCVLDSRQVRGGEIFFAFAGEKADGHDYIEVAWQNGAAVVIAEEEKMAVRSPVEVPQGKALILVESSFQALQCLAKAWRYELGAKVIGITGSNGKTTTKDMVAAVLSHKYRVHKNKENQNNELGLPLTILNAPEGTEILVLEMGMRGLGQIKALCEIALPDTGVITNIGTTHLELLGSQERIAQAKWELIDALPADGVAILNAEDFWSVEKAKDDFHKALFYGLKGKYHDPDFRAENLLQAGSLGTRFTVVELPVDRASAHEGSELPSPCEAYLPLPGEHNVLDALAALSVGRLYGISLEEGCKALAGMELSRMRLELHPGIYRSRLISDVYNANPTSMQASLKVLSERGGKSTLAILGEMYELGEASAEGHYAVGQTAAELGITELITVGDMAREIARGAKEKGMPVARIHPCQTREEAVEEAKKILIQLGTDAWVLIKASRGMKMEEVTKALRQG